MLSRSAQRWCRGRAHPAALTSAVLLALSPRCAVAGSPGDAASGVHVSAGGVPCSPRTNIAERTAALLAPDVDAAATVEIAIEPARPGILVVRFRSREQSLLRSIIFTSDDCDELPTTIAEIGRGWFRRQRQGAPPVAASPVPTPPPSAPTPIPVARATVLQVSSLTDAPRWRLTASGGAFAALQRAQYDLTLAASVERALNRSWGVVVLGGYDARISKGFGDGSRASAALWTVCLLGRLRLADLPESRLELLAGPAVQIVDARLSATAFRDFEKFFDPALVLLLRRSSHFSAALDLVVAAGVSSRLRGEHIHSREIAGDYLDVPAARLELTAGIAWAL